jgi:hypothetical protein
MLRARMGIRALPTLSYLLDLERGHFVAQFRGCAGADRSSISSFHLADLGGEAGEVDRYLTFHILLIIRDHVKPFPRSHPRSLTQSKGIGERGWRRGSASIPLVNLSEQILCDIGGAPWLVVATAGEHGPGDARELVGECDHEQAAMRQAL